MSLLFLMLRRCDRAQAVSSRFYGADRLELLPITGLGFWGIQPFSGNSGDFFGRCLPPHSFPSIPNRSVAVETTMLTGSFCWSTSSDRRQIPWGNPVRGRGDDHKHHPAVKRR